MSREVMQQALDAIEAAHNVLIGSMVLAEAIEALRAELAKPEPEPVAWMMESDKYPKGSSLFKTKREGWHASWKAVPLYRKDL